MTDDPGPEFWRRQHDQLVVINELRRLIDEQPDRFTGLTTNGSAHVVVHLVDPTAAEKDRFRALLQDARRENIAIELVQGLRPLRLLNQIMSDIGRGKIFAEVGVHVIGCGIDTATATVQVTVAARSVADARRACARYGGAIVITAADRSGLTLFHHSRSREGWPVPSVPPASRHTTCIQDERAAAAEQLQEPTPAPRHPRLHAQHREALVAGSVSLGQPVEVGQLQRAASLRGQAIEQRPHAGGELAVPGLRIILDADDAGTARSPAGSIRRAGADRAGCAWSPSPAARGRFRPARFRSSGSLV